MKIEITKLEEKRPLRKDLKPGTIFQYQDEYHGEKFLASSNHDLQLSNFLVTDVADYERKYEVVILGYANFVDN